MGEKGGKEEGEERRGRRERWEREGKGREGGRGSGGGGGRSGQLLGNGIGDISLHMPFVNYADTCTSKYEHTRAHRWRHPSVAAR